MSQQVIIEAAALTTSPLQRNRFVAQADGVEVDNQSLAVNIEFCLQLQQTVISVYFFAVTQTQQLAASTQQLAWLASSG